MAIAARFRHELVIERYTEGAATPRGHAVASFTDSDPIRGLVQETKPKSGGSEITSPDLAETVVINAVVFLAIGTPVTSHDRIRMTSTGAVYDLVGPIRDPGGHGRHLEIAARRTVA